MERVETVILGGGLTGLSTALHLERDWLIVEKEERLGGLTRTEERDGHLFDQTGHWLHLRFDHTRSLVASLLGDELLQIERRSQIYSFGRFTPFPFQANLYGLPLEVVKECLMGVIEARLADGRRQDSDTEPRNFLEYIERHFGPGIARHFMIPYNTKLWGCAPTEITADWCGRFVPKPNLEQVVDGALGLSREQLGYNVRFVYPAHGGIETLVRRMEAALGDGSVLRGVHPVRIDWRARQMELSDGRQVTYDHLVSSVPLPELMRVMQDVPQDVADWVPKLRCTSLRYVNLALDVEEPFDGTHWIYVPENRFPFYRVGCSSNAVASLAPAGRASCYVEVSNAHDASDEEVLASLREFLKETGTIESDDQILFADFRHIDYGYVIFDDNYVPATKAIFDFLGDNRVQSVGRYGAWIYSSMEGALDDGVQAAAAIRRQRDASDSPGA